MFKMRVQASNVLYVGYVIRRIQTTQTVFTEKVKDCNYEFWFFFVNIYNKEISLILGTKKKVRR
jgi:hypothetical protein